MYAQRVPGCRPFSQAMVVRRRINVTTRKPSARSAIAPTTEAITFGPVSTGPEAALEAFVAMCDASVVRTLPEWNRVAADAMADPDVTTQRAAHVTAAAVMAENLRSFPTAVLPPWGNRPLRPSAPPPISLICETSCVRDSCGKFLYNPHFHRNPGSEGNGR